MAALTDTELQDAVVSVGNKAFNKYEGRLSNYGALQAFMDGSNLLLPQSQIEGMKKSDVQVTKIPVLNKFNSTILTARACTITGPTRTSSFKALSYVTKGFEIAVSDAINAGNYISRSEDFAMQMLQGLKAVYNSLDQAAIASLETNRNTTLVESVLETITDATGDYEENDLNDLYYDIPTLMKLNDLGLDGGKLANIMNTESVKTMLKYESQGQNNAINLAGILNGTIESAGNYQHYQTNNITLGANREVHYVAPVEALGLFTWQPFDYRNKGISGDGKKYYTLTDPILGIEWGVIEQTLCADLSAQSTGMTAALQTKYSFTADFSFMTAYSSDADTPIVKFIAPKVPISS